MDDQMLLHKGALQSHLSPLIAAAAPEITGLPDWVKWAITAATFISIVYYFHWLFGKIKKNWPGFWEFVKSLTNPLQQEKAGAIARQALRVIHN